MEHFKSLRLQFIVFILIFIPHVTLQAQELERIHPEEAGLSEERLQRLTTVFEQYAEDQKMAGSVILLAKEGAVFYFEAFGKSDLESDASMEKDAIFRIASQTKALVSVGIMILQEQGKLVLTDPVGKYIPEYMETTVAVPRDENEEGEVEEEDEEEANEMKDYEVVEARRPITIRDLLTHTAGIDYGNGVASGEWEEAGIQGWYFANREEPIEETVTRMASLPMAAHPGERFIYGYSTDILGVVIEKVSEMNLSEFLQAHLLDPLGMADTHFYLPEEKAHRLATVYSATEDSIERAPDPGHMVGQGAYVEGPRMSYSGGAGLLSTATDYYKFLQMMQNGGILNGTRILSPKSVELMTVNHLGDIDFSPGAGFGLGFSTLEDLGRWGSLGSEGEFGWGGAYGSTYWIDPAEELIVVYFKQLIPTNGLDDHDKLRALIYQAIVN